MTILDASDSVDPTLHGGVRTVPRSRYHYMAWLGGRWARVGRTNESRSNAVAIAERAFERTRIPLELRTGNGETIARYL